jgi:hypothetical protein
MVTLFTALASPTLQTIILKGIMTVGREIRRVIGQTEVNFVCAGREDTIYYQVPVSANSVGAMNYGLWLNEHAQTMETL